MDRRDFLRLSGLVTIPIAVPLLSSCSSDSKAPRSKATGPATGSTSATSAASSSAVSSSGAPGSLQSLVNANSGRMDVADAQAETLTKSSRIAFGLLMERKPLTDVMATVYVGKDPDQPPTATARASWIQGEMAPRALYVAEIDFPTAGDWLVGVVARLKDGTVYGGGVNIAVHDTSTSPIAGSKAISVATPTTADLLGADPLCSNVPPCHMHAVSLDAALKNGKPTVLTISAPAYCQTETCGPVVRLIEATVATYAARYNFVHIEAYDKDAVGELRAPAKAWGLQSEPFTFFIRADGIVNDRLPGAFGEDELGARLKALAT